MGEPGYPTKKINFGWFQPIFAHNPKLITILEKLMKAPSSQQSCSTSVQHLDYCQGQEVLQHIHLGQQRIPNPTNPPFSIKEPCPQTFEVFSACSRLRSDEVNRTTSSAKSGEPILRIWTPAPDNPQ